MGDGHHWIWAYHRVADATSLGDFTEPRRDLDIRHVATDGEEVHLVPSKRSRVGFLS